MRDDFAAFILTNGRPNNVKTYQTLRDSGYTGKIYLIVDTEDKTQDQYREKYGDSVLMFDKAEAGKLFDRYENFDNTRSIVYARNANFELAEKVGVRFFWQLDDDYTWWQWRFNHRYQNGYFGKICRIDEVLEACIEYLESIPALSIAWSQGGDHMGADGFKSRGPFMKRKAMNSFICDTQKPFRFKGFLNEDCTTYSDRTCDLFFTLMQMQLTQTTTQANPGGMTDSYLGVGTYVKSFYSVISNPAAVKISAMGQSHYRIHHQVISDNCFPKILSEKHKKKAGS